MLAIAGYLAWTILAFLPVTQQEPDGPGFIGLIVTPIVLVVLAIFLALAGVGWRALSHQTTWRWVSGILLSLGAASLLLSHVDLSRFIDLGGILGIGAEALPWVFVWAAVTCIVLHLIVSWATSGNNQHEAWRGQGPAVVMILALFASMALSSLLVLGAASWLGRPVEEVPQEGVYRTPGAPVTDDVWNTPDAYERFAVLLTVITLLMIVVVLFAVSANLLRFIRFSLPTLTPDDDYRDPEKVGGVDAPDPTYPHRVKFPEGTVRRRSIARRSSHMLHRGEPFFGWLAVFAAVGFLSLSSTTVYNEVKEWVSKLGEGLTTDIRLASTAVLVAIAVAAVAAVATQAAASSERPLGVFWDVVAFFPRAGHPFAPPCFGERVVPELSARTKTWMNDPGRHAAACGDLHRALHGIDDQCRDPFRAARREDQGGPLTGREIADRIAMLSYGTQLRAYFGRFFPSVFGPRVLGVPGVRGPSLWCRDPWSRQVLDEFDLHAKKKQAPELGLEQTPKPTPTPTPTPQPEPPGAELTLTAILGARGWRGAAMAKLVAAHRLPRVPCVRIPQYAESGSIAARASPLRARTCGGSPRTATTSAPPSSSTPATSSSTSCGAPPTDHVSSAVKHRRLPISMRANAQATCGGTSARSNARPRTDRPDRRFRLVAPHHPREGARTP